MPQVLYNKYRPALFGELFGQEHIATTLLNALQSDRVAHAYLFTGTRGTGKTTAGRLLAKALNCRRRIGGEPCNLCVSCKRYIAGRSGDLIEIDAASNRGVDDIRSLRDRASFASFDAFKVYLIDEAHMLTEQAFNALLKLLEEPPSHVVFILATTEATKIPATIASRCQRFDFRRANVTSIVANLRRICVGEEIRAQTLALELIASSVTGSHRDAVSMLDQLVTSYGHKLTADNARVGLGLIHDGRTGQLVQLILKRDLVGGLMLLGAVRDDGLNLKQFQRELVADLRAQLFARPKSVLIRQALRLFAEAVVTDSTVPLDIALSECCLARSDMAKPYRDQPLANEGVGLPLQKLRVTKATELLGRMVNRFDADFVLAVATEVGLEEACDVDDESGQIEFDLTSLQLVSLGAALAACAEYRDGRAEQRAKRKKFGTGRSD